MAELLQVRNLTVAFQHSSSSAVDRVSFDLNEGEALGVLGESGSGKTTLGRTLLRLGPAATDLQGSVHFQGIDILRANEASLCEIRGARISLISQEPDLGLNPFIRVGEQVAEVLRAHTNLNKSQRRQQVREILTAVGLGDQEIYSAYPHQLSGGQRQRVVIAQALVCKPALLVADEPTSALDNVIQTEVLTLIKELRRSLRLALIFITHEITLLNGLIDRVVVMRAGRIVKTGTLPELYHAPEDPYIAGLLNVLPFPPPAPA